MGDELHDAFSGMIEELVTIERRLEAAQPPLDEHERVESYRWIFSVLQVALDAHVWADTGRPRFVDIVGPNKKWGGDNTDAFYKHAPVDPARTYRVRCEPGDAVYLSLTVYGGPSDGRYSERIVASANDRSVERETDGSFELVLSPEPHDGNWLQLEPDAVCAITRDYVDDPATARRAQWTIEALDPPSEKDDSIATVAAKFRAARVFLDEQARISPVRVGPPNEVLEPYPVPATTFGWAAGDAAYAMGSFQLAEGEALVIDGRSPECAFWNLCLWNPFLHTFDDAYGRVTINGSQVVMNDDGSWRIVVAARDTGHPNWVSTQGHGRGLLWFRWFLPVETPPRPLLSGCLVVSRPAPVRIEDLRNPQFSPEAKPILDVLSEYGHTVTLDPDVLCAAAEEQTGLDHWGDDAFRERLAILCRSLREEVDLSPLGVALTYESLLQPLRNRLLIEDLIAGHPEIEDIPVERPIVVCGLPRTGTTHLHNLLSSDPALRHLPYWESLEPLPRPHDVAAPGEPDPRVARCAAACDMLDVTMPLFKRMHEMTADHAHEEIQLLAIDVSGMFYETTALMTGWRDHYKATDQTASYQYLRRVLQVLTWQRGGTRWVLKSPQHLEQFGPLVSTFPDATFVLTHRDPVAVSASLVTMLGYTARLRVDHPDPLAIGAYWSARVEDLLLGCVRDRHLLPADRSIDVRFDEFMADEGGLVEAIYELAGQPYDEDVRAAMSTFMEEHPRGRHGTIDYDLAAFGIDPDERRRALRAYTDRFGV